MDCLVEETNDLSLKTPLNLIARIILLGVHDEDSPFSKLNGIPHVLQMIWSYVLAVKIHIKPCIKRDDYHHYGVQLEAFTRSCCLRFHQLVEFPKPKGINVNMMPFIMAQKFKYTKLPNYLKKYYKKLIRGIFDIYRHNEFDKICYLTVHESVVEEGTSQRRPGLHTESPGIIYVKNQITDQDSKKLSLVEKGAVGDIYPMLTSWGISGFYSGDVMSGGIYMASNIEDSCEVWDCRIEADSNGNEIIGKHGDVEHLRSFLPKRRTKLRANTMYWITDRTPHESLPLQEKTHRQFFRLVTPSVWYEDHSTKNPNGVVPDPKITRIVGGSKFDKEVVTVVA